MSELLALRCPASSSSPAHDTDGVPILLGLQLGWMGHENIGDDIMPPLFAHVLADALASELPHLRVTVEARDCVAASRASAVTKGKAAHSTEDSYRFLPVTAPKHFWVLGGGSLLEYFNHEVFRGLSATAFSAAAGAPPLYLFGAGFQRSQRLSADALAASFGTRKGDSAGLHGAVWGSGGSGGGGGCTSGGDLSGCRLLWGGVRGPLSRDIFNFAAGAGAVEILGDPGFFGDVLEGDYSPLSAVQVARLEASLPPKPYIVHTCEDRLPSLLAGLTPIMAARPDVSLVTLSIGRFSSRFKAIASIAGAMNRAFGDRHPSTRPLSLTSLRDLPALFHVWRGATLGINCMLHAGILQAALGTPTLADFSAFKHQDAWATSGAGALLMRGMGTKALAGVDVPWRADALLADEAKKTSSVDSAGTVRTTVGAFRARTAARHAAAMASFLSHLLGERYPEVGRALRCAPRGGILIVRSHTVYEGAVIELEWRGE